jgi:hypothetical protein
MDLRVPVSYVFPVSGGICVYSCCLLYAPHIVCVPAVLLFVVYPYVYDICVVNIPLLVMV